MTRLRLVAATVVVLIVVVTIASLGTPNTPADRSNTPSAAAGPGDVAATAAGASSATPIAAVAKAGDPELEGLQAQRPISENAPSVRTYERTHRLLNATPITYAGVTFDAAGRTGSGRVRITGDGFGLSEPTVRDAYRRLLRHLGDRGRAYHLTVIAPVAHAP